MIETVLGPIAAADLGPTSTNEHLLTDSRSLFRPTREGGELEGPLHSGMLGDLRWSWLSSRDNLTLDDPDTAVDELADATASGLRSVVEATSWGMGPRHADLPVISRRSGVHVVAAYGSYIDKTLPPWWRELSEAEIEARFRHALQVAVPGTSFRAGLLGLLGTSATALPPEERALRAAGRAAAEASAAVSIRLDAAARRGLDVLATLTDQGMPASRVLFCNVDKVLDDAYIADLADSGAVAEFAFGSEHNFGDGMRDHTDADRLTHLLHLLEARPDAAITLSCSVWTKGQLRRHGGMGYGHIVRRIVPALERAGIPRERIDGMLVGTPARLLDRG